jgi:guanylate kinase
MIYKSNHLVLVGGPSGIGKTTIINNLINDYSDLFCRPNSFSTRAKRENEDNTEFEFIDESLIKKLYNDGKLINLDYVFGNYYAISKESVVDIINKGKIPIKEVHPSNHKKIKSAFSSTSSLILLPCNNSFSFKEKNRDELDYYSSLNLDDFDLTIHVDHEQSVEDTTHNIKYALHSYLGTIGYYPPIKKIIHDNKIGYDEIAPEFDEELRITTRNFHELSLPHFTSFINSHVSNQSKCVEIGPGNGWLTKNTHLLRSDYTSIEPSNFSFSSKSKSNLSKNIFALDICDQLFDFAFSSLADPYLHPIALTEIRRILKKDGQFVLSTPSRIWAEGIRAENKINETIFELTNGKKVSVHSFTFQKDALSEL